MTLLKKRSFYAMVVLCAALVLVSVFLVIAKQEQKEMRQTIDATYKESFLRILDSMRQMQDPACGAEEKSLLAARDIGYGYNLRTLQFSTSYAGEDDFYTINLLLDNATGTDAIYTLTFSDELYDALTQLYEADFQDQELLEKARILLEDSIA